MRPLGIGGIQDPTSAGGAAFFSALPFDRGADDASASLVAVLAALEEGLAGAWQGSHISSGRCSPLCCRAAISPPRQGPMLPDGAFK